MTARQPSPPYGGHRYPSASAGGPRLSRRHSWGQQRWQGGAIRFNPRWPMRWQGSHSALAMAGVGRCDGRESLVKQAVAGVGQPAQTAVAGTHSAGRWQVLRGADGDGRGWLQADPAMAGSRLVQAAMAGLESFSERWQARSGQWAAMAGNAGRSDGRDLDAMSSDGRVTQAMAGKPGWWKRWQVGLGDCDGRKAAVSDGDGRMTLKRDGRRGPYAAMAGTQHRTAMAGEAIGGDGRKAEISLSDGRPSGQPRPGTPAMAGTVQARAMAGRAGQRSGDGRWERQFQAMAGGT